tara:strand:- start:54 stop:1034 length:981 start_codon:yes stop_codon:yes gene_type:complete
MVNSYKIMFYGGGAWGQALAIALSNCNTKSSILVSDKKRMQSLNNGISKCFPGITFPKNIDVFMDKNILKNADIVFITTQSFRVQEAVNEVISSNPNVKIILTSKGFANDKGELFAEIISKKHPNLIYGILTGPTFASEIAKNLPSAAVIASESEMLSKKISTLFRNSCLRLYPSNDIIGASVSGAIKNIFAIGTGISDGLKLGENAKSAIITRGIGELSQIILKLGGKKETAFGLAGIGDMILTCSSPTSRNMKYGLDLAQNKNNENIPLVEGLYALKSAKYLSDLYKLDTPIINSIFDYIYNHKSIDKIILSLLNRPIGIEFKN